MKKIAVHEYLMLLLSIILVGCDPVSPPDPLSLTDAELRSFTHCKVSFQCELLNCAVGKEPFRYKWEGDTMTYQIEWDSTGFHAEQKYTNSISWTEANGAESYIYDDDSKSIKSYISENNALDSIFLVHSSNHTHHAAHMWADGNQNDFGHYSNVTLVQKTDDSVVYYLNLNSNQDRLDSASYFDYNSFVGNFGTTKSCGISWQNNAESYIRLVLFKQ